MRGPAAPNLPAPRPEAPDGGSRPTTANRPGRGMAFAVFGALLLTSNDTIAKLLSESWPVGEIMALRGTLILGAILIILMLRRNLDALRIQNRKVMAIRAVSITAATFTFRKRCAAPTFRAVVRYRMLSVYLRRV